MVCTRAPFMPVSPIQFQLLAGGLASGTKLAACKDLISLGDIPFAIQLVSTELPTWESSSDSWPKLPLYLLFGYTCSSGTPLASVMELPLGSWPVFKKLFQKLTS